MNLSISHGVRRNPFGNETKQLVAKAVSWIRMKEGLDHELAFGERISEIDEQVDLFPGGILIEADGPVTGVAHGGHRQVLLVARDAVLFADVPEERLARSGRGRLQRRQRLLGRSDYCRMIELSR